MIRHIFWDWNGTLVDDAAELHQAVSGALVAIGLPPVSEAELRARFTRPLRSLYECLTDGQYQDQWTTWYQTFVAASHTAAPPRLVQDARSAMERWHAAGGTQSLLSQRPTDLLTVEVSATPLGGLIDGIRGSMWAEELKQDMLREELAVRGLDCGEILVIGDTADDLEAAHSVGATAIICDTHSFAPVNAAVLLRSGVPQVNSLPEAIDLALALRSQASYPDLAERRCSRSRSAGTRRAAPDPRRPRPK